MKATVDQVGRIVLPKPLRDALGLTSGMEVDVSRYGNGLQIVPGGRTAQVVHDVDGRLVLTGSVTIDDDDVLSILDDTRR